MAKASPLAGLLAFVAPLLMACPVHAQEAVVKPVEVTFPGCIPTDVADYAAGGQGIERWGEGGFIYVMAVPEGLYKVTLTLGDAKRAGRTTVKAEGRRLMLRDVVTRRGESATRSFLVAVRSDKLPEMPQGGPVLPQAVQIDGNEVGSADWDDRLSLEFLGQPCVSRIHVEPVQAPTVFLVGDSTVADQMAEPYASWGQMLPAMLDEGVAVANHAKSGGTMKSFIVQMRLSKVLEQVREGDWLLIQFGHNDQKANWPLTYVSPDGTYPAYLRSFIAEARARGVHPVLVTSPERRNFDGAGRIKPSLDAYAQAVRDVAKAEGVPLVDLNAASIAIMEALGPEQSPKAFARDGEDRTHNNNYGAWLFAAAVAQGLRSAVPELASHVTLPAFDPAHPPLPADLQIKASLAHLDEKPAGN